MTRVAKQSAIVQDAFRLLYEPIREELDAAEEVLRTEVHSEYPCVDELVRHSFRLGGKRLRPSLLLLSAKAIGNVTHEHAVLAAVVEMIHTATLVHDDVLDDATLRRHLDTVNARWDNQASVLLGDFLFSHAVYLVATLESTFACKVIGRTTNIVCEGELRQINSRGNFALAEEEYLSIISAKTAELCACCGCLGAHYAGATQAQEDALVRYGRFLGIAFQIVDDLLDLEGDEATTGKSLGTDLEQQKPTLPLIRLLDQAGAKQRRHLVALLERPDNQRGDLEPWLRQSDCLAYARQKAVWYAQQAQRELRCLPSGPICDILHQLTDLVVQRRR